MTSVNKEYKDRLFCFIFGREENKEWTLSLYNAVNQTSHTDVSAIKLNTIENVMYLGMHNDVSFLYMDEINDYEQQSTGNPNMPLRQTHYACNQFEKYIVSNRLNKYGSKLLHLPTPRLVTFYNGTDDMDDELTLSLKESFADKDKADIDASVRMININYGHSKKILDACEPLKEYTWLVDMIRKYRTSMELEAAVDRAIEEMPRSYVIKKLLEEHKSEVKGMLLTEYNEAEAMELFKEEGREEGRDERSAEVASDLLKEGASVSFITKISKLPEETVRKLAVNMGITL